MYQNQISELPYLSEERLENIFNVYLDDDNKFFYNILETVDFPENLPDGLFSTYTVEPGDTLPFISYKVFGTIFLWWVICIVNKIDNPVQPLKTGTVLKILNDNTVRVLLQEINS